MPRNYTILDQIDNQGNNKIISQFSGGLDTTTTNDLLPDNKAIVRKNWGQDELGALKKVNGYTKKNAIALASKPVRGLFRVYKSSGSDEMLAICNGVVSYSDDEGTTFTGATGGSGFTETDYWTGVNYNDLFFFTGQTDNLKHYTPGTNTVAAATDKPAVGCKFIFKRADRRLVCIVNATNSSTLYYSKVDPTGTDADDFSAVNDAGSIAIDGAKSDPLTGGASIGTYDLIYKDYCSFKVWNYPNPKSIRIIGGAGCASPYTVAQGEGMVFALGHDSISMWDGNSFTKISEPIKNILATIPQAYIQNSFAVCRNGFYWLFYPGVGSTVNNKCLVYDIRNSNPYDNQCIWFERDDLAMNSPLVLDGVGDNNEIYAGDSASTGFVYRLDNGTSDNTANITAYYQTKYDNMGASNIVKRFSKIYISCYNTSGTFTVNWYCNKGTSITGSYTITETSGELIDIEPMPDSCVGTDLSIKITHAGNSTAPIIRSIEVAWEALYDKG